MEESQSPEYMHAHYAALFVKFPDDLKKMFPPVHENVFAHHMTLTYKPKTMKGLQVGKESKIKVIGRATDEKGDALIIDPSSLDTDVEMANKHLHITLSTTNDETGKKIHPSYSNTLIENAPNIEMFDSPVEINVVEGYNIEDMDGNFKDVIKDPSDF